MTLTGCTKLTTFFVSVKSCGAGARIQIPSNFGWLELESKFFDGRAFLFYGANHYGRPAQHAAGESFLNCIAENVVLKCLPYYNNLYIEMK